MPEEVEVVEMVEVEKVKATPAPKTPKKKVEREGEKSGPPQTKTVNIDNSYEQVLQWNDEGHKLAFEVGEFLHLPDEVIDELRRDNFKSYYVSLNQVVIAQNSKTKRPDPDYLKDLELGVLGSNARHRMQQALRERDGWHGFLCAPDELDERLQMGYKKICKLSKEQQKLVDSGKKEAKDFWGEEAGSPVRIGQEDKPELLALEVPLAVWKKHLAAIGYRSKGMYEQNKQDYLDRVKELGLIPFDEEANRKRG